MGCSAMTQAFMENLQLVFTELAGNLVNCVLMGSGKLRLPQKEAEELLGTSLLAVVHCNSVDNVVPIIPAAPCLAIVVAAMRAGLPNWSLEEVATLLRDSGSRRGLACLQPSQIRSSEAPSQGQPGTWWPQQPSRPWRTSASGAEQAGAGRQPGPGGVSC